MYVCMYVCMFVCTTRQIELKIQNVIYTNITNVIYRILVSFNTLHKYFLKWHSSAETYWIDKRLYFVYVACAFSWLSKRKKNEN